MDLRVLAATNKNLTEEVAERRFREDLYFRLKVVSIDLPPLRDRVVDIPFLVDALMHELVEQHGTRVKGIAPDVVRLLEDEPWPGNVRELRNVLENMVVTGSHDILQLSDLPPSLQQHGVRPPTEGGAEVTLGGRTAEDVERQHIRQTLELVGGNRAKAARVMGIGERTLYRKIKQYDLT